MATALYGSGGFYRRPEGPGAHFRTSVTDSPLFAAAMVSLLESVDAALGSPPRLDVVDVGAGRGEFLTALATAAPAALRARLRLRAVELADRPAELPREVVWSADLPTDVVGLLVANEWLDNVPVDVVVATPVGPRLVVVDPDTGNEAVGDPPPPADLAWLAAHWPMTNARPGDRAEVGRARDAAWAQVIRHLRRGTAVAIDYATSPDDRAAGGHAAGTLTGYRLGRQVAPVPDGSCDLTAHVALDACAAAGVAAGATATLLTTQRSALRALGVDASRPAYELAARDPATYVAALASASQAAELLARGGLGDFGWLVQTVGMPLPPALAATVVHG
jgi:SAM-dependent MidA family methyltransferase